MRQRVSENNQAPLATPAAPKAICRNPPLPDHNNQSEENLTASEHWNLTQSELICYHNTTTIDITENNIYILQSYLTYSVMFK